MRTRGDHLNRRCARKLRRPELMDKRKERLSRDQHRRGVYLQADDRASRTQASGAMADELLSGFDPSPQEFAANCPHLGDSKLTASFEELGHQILPGQETSWDRCSLVGNDYSTYQGIRTRHELQCASVGAYDWVCEISDVSEQTSLVLPAETMEEQLLESFLSYARPSGKLNGEFDGWVISLRKMVERYEPLRYIALAIAATDITKISSIVDTKSDLHVAFHSACLQGLHRDLNDPEKYGSDSTILTYALLSRYELLVGRSNTAYRYDTEGLNAMIETRKPSAFVNGLMANIFAMNQADEIRRCLEDGKTTLYHRPEWSGLSEDSHPQIYNKFIGTYLNTLLLRLVVLTSSSQRSDKAARVLEKDLLEERARWLARGPFIVSNQQLCAKHHRAKKMRLDLSPCGDSICYDDPNFGESFLSMAAITFDSAILHLHRIYRKLRRSRDKDRAISTVRCAQYIMANECYQDLHTAGELAFHLITAQKFIERDTALQAWVTHSLHLTGVPLWSKYSSDKPVFYPSVAQVLTFLAPS